MQKKAAPLIRILAALLY